MFILYFLLPVLGVLFAEIESFRSKGVKKTVSRLGFWLFLCGAELFTVALLILLFMDFGAFLTFSWLRLFAAALGALFFSVFVDAVRSLRQKPKKTLSVAVLLLATALFLEGTVFNFRFYQTYAYEQVDCSDSYTLSRHFIETEAENEYAVEGDYPTIYLNDLDVKVHNIYVDITALNASRNAVNTYVGVYMTDESNENYFHLPSQTVMSEVESTKYLNLLTNGNTEKLKLELSTSYGQTYRIDGIRLNVPQPFHFSFLRVAAVFLVAFLFWLLRPKSGLWRHAFTDSSAQRAVTVGVVVLEVALLLVISVFNPVFYHNPARHHAQYQELAESFLEGRLYLEEEPPVFLAEMENPYDYYERSLQSAAAEESYYWDAAYYEGHYYVYFGVLPVLVFYLPFRALTGHSLTNLSVLQILLAFFAVGSFLLIAKIIKKYFRREKIPYLSYPILSLIFVNASGAVFIAKRPDFYSIPILFGLTLTVFGLYCWLRSTDGEGRVSPLWGGLGSLCMALVAACRPQLLLVSVLAVVIFWSSVFRDRSLFSKKGFGSTLAMCLPYLLVAAGVMWYNAARFGSPFDFGQNYNLTTNDMTGRGFRVERVGLALFTYFFQPPVLTASFPFLEGTDIRTNYMGVTITEPTFGGIFLVIPLLWVLLLVWAHRKELLEKRILAFCTVPVALSVFLGLFDAQGAGLLGRYVSDFAFLACLSAIFMIFFLYQKREEHLTVHSFLRFSLFASGAYCFLCVFAIYGTEIFYRNPYLFNYVSELVQFW